MAIAPIAADAIVKQMGQLARGVNRMITQQSGNSQSGGGQRAAPKETKKARRPKNKQPAQKVGRSLVSTSPDMLRVSQKAVFYLTNSELNKCSLNIGLAFSSHLVGARTLGTVMSRLNTIAGLYRMFRIEDLKVYFRSSVPDSAYGNVGIGVDLSVNPGVPADYDAVIHHRPSVLCDLKDDADIRWNSNYGQKKDPRFISNPAAEGVQGTEDEMSFGNIQLFARNNLASAADIGLLMFDCTLTFIGPR